ncbi:non-ribosomal peptide synthetase [Pseudoalteromonas rubra]|uniref:non-ribosomal peptide synthetase n=1 Tax=Pseudoalteromonas rubra TaxID=43658 RepID=UPI000F7BA470|nr:non-ribosomal peptide synthetase [Pseudoalteromonas rubra]
MESLLKQFQRKNILLKVDGDELVVKAPAGTLSQADRAQLRENKAALIDYLKQQRQPSVLRHIAQAPVLPAYPLSFAQQRLALIDQLEQGSHQYNVPAVLRLTGTLSVERLTRALQALLSKHTQLAMGIELQGEHFVQRPLDPALFELEFRDLSTSTSAQADFEAIAIAQANRAFVLDSELKMRAELVKMAEQHHKLLLTFHHIATDGWSTALLISDLNHFYNNPDDACEPHALEYHDFAYWQHQHYSKHALATSLAYWQQRLSDAPQISALPTDRARGAKASYAGDNVFVTLSVPLSAQVQQFCRRSGVSEFAFWQGAFLWLRGLYSGEMKQVIGVPMANRESAQLHPIVGFFVNTLPFFTELKPELGLRSWLKQLQLQNAQDMAHQRTPFEWIVEQLADRSMSVHPLFQSLFVFQNNRQVALSLNDLSVELEDTRRKSALFDLQLEVHVEDAVRLRWEFNTDLYDKQTVVQMAANYEALIQAWCSAQPDSLLSTFSLTRPIDSLPVLPPPAAPLMPLWHDMVQRYADSPALTDGTQTLSYQALFERVERAVACLHTHHVGSKDKVAIALPRSVDYVVAVLACMRLGAAYVPLDLTQPATRHAMILEDAQPKVMICAEPDTSLGQCVQITTSSLRCHPAQSVPVAWADAATELYVLYTSGSTGKPKGVRQTHGALANHIASVKAMTPALSGALKGAFIAATGFDMSFTDFMLPLTSGGCCVVLDDGCRKDMQKLADAITTHQLQWLNLPYSLLQMLATHISHQGGRLPSLKVVTSSAEALQITPEIRRFFSDHPQCRLVNHYGPTETHVVTGLNLPPEPASWPVFPAIGQAMSGNHALVCNADLMVLADGLPGELVILGHSVAAGYRDGAPEQHRFVTLMLANQPVRAYRTGDRVYRNHNGELIYLGRIDRQVHHKGYRIELGEIESIVRQHSNIEAAVALLSEENGLELYYIPAPHTALSSNEIQQFCHNYLPDYMIPGRCLTVTHIPLGSNGKVDTAALRAAGQDCADSKALQRPHSETEIALLEMWNQWLDKPLLDISIDFFVAGGDSMKIVQLVHQIQQYWQVPLTASHFYLLPSVQLQAQVIDLMSRQQSHTGPVTRLTPSSHSANPSHDEVLKALAIWQAVVIAGGRIWRERHGNTVCLVLDENHCEVRCQQVAEHANTLLMLVDEAACEQPNTMDEHVEQTDVFAMSEQQNSIWMHIKTRCIAALYNMPFAMRLQGQLDVERLQKTLDTMLLRHTMLRCAVVETEQPAKLQVQTHQHWPLRQLDLRQLPATEQHNALQQALAQDATEAFDFTHGPLARASLVQLSDTEWVLSIVVHHLASDGYSSSSLIRTFSQYYAQEEEFGVKGDQSYRHFIAWQQDYLDASAGRAARAFWRDYLHEAPLRHGLCLRADAHIQPPTLAGQRVSRVLTPEQYQQFKQSAASQGVTPYTLLNGLFALLLSRYSGESDVVFGTLYNGRVDSRFQDTVGMFTNTLPVRTKVQAELTLADFIAAQTHNLQQLERHQQYPFNAIVDAHNPPRLNNTMPIVQVLLSWQNFLSDTLRLPQLSAQLLDFPVSDCKFELKLDAIEQHQGLQLNWEFRTALFEETFVAQLADSLLDLIVHSGDNWHRPVAKLPMCLSAQAAIDRGCTQPLPAEFGLASRLYGVVVNTPDKLAIQTRTAQLTFAQLWYWVSAYQSYLQAHGVKAGDKVALYMDKHLTMPALYFAIWQLGATVVPLDRRYPNTRVAHIVADAQARLLLCEDAEQFRETNVAAVTDWQSVVPEKQMFLPRPQSDARASAYILYTSGTTGKPKGVCVGHQQLFNFKLAFMEQLTELTGGGLTRWLWNASPGFDTSLKGMITLAMGCELVIPQEVDSLDMVSMADLIKRFHIPIYNGTVTQFKHLQQQLDQQQPLHLILGGEAMNQALWEQLQEYCERTTSRCLNAYGPTETTINASYSVVTQAPYTNIGNAVVNAELAVVDEFGQLLPKGAIGELWISGELVAQGYHGLASGASAFADHASHTELSRSYRSKDKVVMLDNGSLLYLGRMDRQVKVRGYRIELGEIERACMRHDAVAQAHICIRQFNNEDQLVAYLAGEQAGLCELVRAELMQCLPAYMIPAAFVQLPQLPCNQHGKIDESKLPPAQLTQQHQAVEPQTQTEQQVSQQWQKVLGLSTLDCTTNFFALGGNSLLAVRALQQLEIDFELKLPLNLIMEYPDVQSLATYIDNQKQQQNKELTDMLQDIESMSEEQVSALLDSMMEQ